jgi:small neutral amino acid transporter SnatA (MarC family)
MLKEIIQSVSFLLVLLNPFLIIVYLIEIIKSKTHKVFSKIIFRAGIISFITFSLFALIGDQIFTNIFNASFASFQIFGGIIFLLTGIHFIFKGSASIEALRGESKHVIGAIAMPIFIGPGTISYSVIIGEKLNGWTAVLAIFITLCICITLIILLKKVHDHVQKRNEELIEQYIDISGRVIAFLLGTISIEMIMNGIHFWIKNMF